MDTGQKKYSSVCNKARYETRSLAKSALKMVKRVSRRTKVPESVYYCHDCSGWHMTSIKKSEWLGLKPKSKYE